MSADREEAPGRCKSRRVAFALVFLLGAAAALAISAGRGFALGQALYENARSLSDGFFAAGFAIAAAGALSVVSSGTDFFDIFSYAFKSLIVLFTALRKPSEHLSYLDYKAEKRERRARPPWFLLFDGLLLLALSVGFLLLYYGKMPG